jgi:hypothetical protein
MLSHGYYVVKNRSDMTIDMIKGLEQEKEYFTTHVEYSKPVYKDKIGLTNLSYNLSKILIESINELLPNVLAELGILEQKIITQLDKFGQDVPTTREGKISLMNKYISSFYYKFIDSIESRGTTLNTGKLLKDNFLAYKDTLINICPFKQTEIYTDSYFETILSSFEGNHMSFHVPPIQILEACMKDSVYKPIDKLTRPSLLCVDVTIDLLQDLIKDLISQEEFSQFPQFSNQIQTLLTTELINKTKISSKEHIKYTLETESNYIWTDSEDFVKTLKSFQESSYSTESIVAFLEGYFTPIKQVICHIVPKICMTTIITSLEKEMLGFLLNTLVTEDNFNLLKRDKEIEVQKQYLSDLNMRVVSVKNYFKTHNI